MAAVTMLHPASGRVQRASRDAFERVWSAQGWVLTEDEPKPADKPAPRKRAAKKTAPPKPTE